MVTLIVNCWVFFVVLEAASVLHYGSLFRSILGWNIRLLTAAYSGIVASGLMVIVIAWCVRMRDPLFTSVFSPLMLVLVTITGSLMLHENLYLGSVIGAVLIMVGLYMVLWGKSKETKKVTHLVSSQIEVVVTSMTVDNDNGVCRNNNHPSNNSKIVAKQGS